MPNNYFQFKQFIIYHDKCAMKVGTDGVLLGAWTSSILEGKILDIGTGSGLIAIMSAQKNLNAIIDAVEIDLDSVIQAKENANNCPWSNRIKIYHDSFQNFSKRTHKYSLITSNPPYFNNSLLPDKKSRSKARHTLSLNYEELLQGASILLEQNGIFSVIIPYDSANEFIEKALNFGLYCKRNCLVYPTPQSNPKRVLLDFSPNKNVVSFFKNEKIIIEEFGRHKYSEKYISLTKNFYLNL